jgi:hypothetical protein
MFPQRMMLANHVKPPRIPNSSIYPYLHDATYSLLHDAKTVIDIGHMTDTESIEFRIRWSVIRWSS